MTCEFPNYATFAPYARPLFSDPESGAEQNALNTSVIVEASENRIDFTLYHRLTVTLDKFGYQEPFSTVIPPYLKSGVTTESRDFSIVSSTLSFQVPPGKIGRVRRLRGICDGQPFAIQTSIYETEVKPATGRRIST